MNKEAIVKFLTESKLDSTTINKIIGEGFTEAEAATAATGFLNSRKKHYEATLLKDAKKLAQEEGFKGGVLKTIKSVNKSLGLGLTNSDIELFKGEPETFATKSLEIIDLDKEKLRGNADDATKAELTNVKASLAKSNSELADERANKQKEIDKLMQGHTRLLQEKLGVIALNNSVPKKFDKDAQGASFVLDGLKQKLKNLANIKEDGTLTSKDSDTGFVYEDDVYDTAEDFLSKQLEKQGYISEHNGSEQSDAVKKRIAAERRAAGGGDSKESAELIAKRKEFERRRAGGRGHSAEKAAPTSRF